MAGIVSLAVVIALQLLVCLETWEDGKRLRCCGFVAQLYNGLDLDSGG